MPIQSNASERHQEGVGRLIHLLTSRGLLVIQAQYGNHLPPEVIGGRRPDVIAVDPMVKGQKMIGEVELADDLITERTRQQLRDLANWAKRQSPEAKLVLGVIPQPNPSRSFREQLTYSLEGWEIVNV